MHAEHFRLLLPDAAAAAGDDSDSEDDMEHVLAAQRGHSVEVSRNHYGIEQNTLAGVPLDLMHAFGEASRNFWKVNGMHPTLLILAPADMQIAVNKSLYPYGSSIFHPPSLGQSSSGSDASSSSSQFSSITASSDSSALAKSFRPGTHYLIILCRALTNLRALGEQFVDTPVLADYIALCVSNGLADASVRFHDIAQDAVASGFANFLTR